MNLNSKIGLGSVQFGIPYGVSNNKGQTSSAEVTKILNYANKIGISVIDTASAYGNAEEVLGHNDLNSFKIISKFMPQEAGESLSIQLEKSLANLKIDSFYGYLAHRPLNLINNQNHWEELLMLQQENRIKKIGFSLNEPRELDLLLDKGMMPDLIQVPYNYFDTRFADVLSDLKDNGCEIHTRSTFLQGLFFTDPKQLDGFFNEVKPLLTQLQKKSPLNAALLKFVMDKPFIDKVIIGVENELQLVQNIENLKNASELPELEYKITDNILIPSRWPKN